MNTTGEKLITSVCARLKDEDIRCYDSQIVRKIKSLSAEELSQILFFGDVVKWNNDRKG